MTSTSSTKPSLPRLTPEEADRAALRYRPSWDLASLAASGPEIAGDALHSSADRGSASMARVTTTRLSPTSPAGKSQAAARSVFTKLDPSEIEEAPDASGISRRDTVPAHPRAAVSPTRRRTVAAPISPVTFAVLGVVTGLALVAFLLSRQATSPGNASAVSTSGLR